MAHGGRRLPRVPSPHASSRAAETLASIAGRYATQDGVVEIEPAAGGLRVVLPDGSAVGAHAIGERTFELSDGDDAGTRLDFPRPGFARIGSRAVERLP